MDAVLGLIQPVCDPALILSPGKCYPRGSKYHSYISYHRKPTYPILEYFGPPGNHSSNSYNRNNDNNNISNNNAAFNLSIKPMTIARTRMTIMVARVLHVSDMHMYVYIYSYVNTYLYVYTYAYTYIYICMQIYAYIYI